MHTFYGILLLLVTILWVGGYFAITLHYDKRDAERLENHAH